jgi:hypothetical protein
MCHVISQDNRKINMSMLRIIMQLHIDITIKITRKKFHIQNRRERGFYYFFSVSHLREIDECHYYDLKRPTNEYLIVRHSVFNSYRILILSHMHE